MHISCPVITARSAVVLIDDGGLYNAREVYRLTLNGLAAGEQATATGALYGLTPDTGYELCAYIGDELAHSVCFTTPSENLTIDVSRFGAKGDGLHDDTAAIQAAIACCPINGRVLIRRGRYIISGLFLKSHMSLELCKGAELMLTTERERIPMLPGLLESADGRRERCLGLCEGNPLTMYAAAINGIDVTDVHIYGRGIINGQAPDGDWWLTPKQKHGAWRGYLLYLNGCEDITVHGLSFRGSPSWNLHPAFSSRLAFYGITVTAPADSPNTDGFNPESCKDVTLTGARFSLGDDCIAIKSGKLYLGRKLKTPCEGIRISHCLMENGHGGVTIGSEAAGGVRDVTVRDCLMRRTDRGLRIKTRRGRGKDGVIDDISLENVVMQDVKAPLTVNALYFCDPDGHGEYAQSTTALPVDERTPEIKRIALRGVAATGCGACAAYILGLPEAPVSEISIADSSFDFDPSAEPFQPVMADCVTPEARLGVVARNVKKLALKNVRITGHTGERVTAQNVESTEDSI